MPKFVKGQSGNPKGRPKGKPNRTTDEIRDFIQRIVSENLDSLPDDLQKMTPANRWIILDKVTKYFLPALTKNDNNNLNSGEVTIKVEYIDSPNNNNDDKTV